jgi:hypothetical protein
MNVISWLPTADKTSSSYINRQLIHTNISRLLRSGSVASSFQQNREKTNKYSGLIG